MRLKSKLSIEDSLVYKKKSGGGEKLSLNIIDSEI